MDKLNSRHSLSVPLHSQQVHNNALQVDINAIRFNGTERNQSVQLSSEIESSGIVSKTCHNTWSHNWNTKPPKGRCMLHTSMVSLDWYVTVQNELRYRDFSAEILSRLTIGMYNTTWRWKLFSNEIHVKYSYVHYIGRRQTFQSFIQKIDSSYRFQRIS